MIESICEQSLQPQARERKSKDSQQNFEDFHEASKISQIGQQVISLSVIPANIWTQHNFKSKQFVVVRVSVPGTQLIRAEL